MKRQKSYKPKLHKTKKKFNLNKRNSRKMGYDQAWSKYRFRFLHYNPQCYVCGQESKVVDHWQAHKGDDELFKNTHNHLPMCTACHNYCTGKFDRYNPPKTEEKMKYIKEYREKYNVTVKVTVLGEYEK